ncbi:PilT protein domain protein [Desulfurococcaceae archaeon AG1]|jgi:predicted nucleic acid-binding protein|nr:PilT protein domain protein [Desulfurococcaceae archaeon AG1]
MIVIVIDGSALVKYLLYEDGWEEISRYIREMRPLVTIDHALKEVANGILKHKKLYSMIGDDKIIRLYRGFLELVRTGVIIIEPEDKYIAEALEIALNHDISIYDSLYISLALKYGELLTCDARQAEVASKLGVKVYYIA